MYSFSYKILTYLRKGNLLLEDNFVRYEIISFKWKVAEEAISILSTESYIEKLSEKNLQHSFIVAMY